MINKWFQSVVTLEEIAKSEASHPVEPVTIDELPEAIADVPWQHPTKHKIVGICAVVILIVIGWTLSSIYLSKITIADRDILAHSSDTKLASAISKQATDYRLTVAYPDGKKKHYPMSKLGLTVDKTASVKATRDQQHKFTQRISWWKPVPAAVVLKTNKPVLNNFIATETNVTVQPAQDAVLSIDKGDIRIADAVAGKQYGLAKPKTAIMTSVQSLRSSTIKLKTLTVNPPLTGSLLEPYKVRIKTTIDQPVSFTLGQTVITPTPADIANWLEITPDNKSKKVDVTVNSGKVLEYINNVASRYVHPAKAQIETKQQDDSMKVLVGGVDGVDVTNKSAVAADVAKTLLAGKGIELSLAVSHESFQTIATGSYDKWIEVDLTHKRMYAYEKDNLVKTELITAGAPSTPTVTGQYAIYAKYDQQDMRGNNVDGSRYFQPNVRWISYFYRDYAIHGNYWRPLSYFGNINSSHGCVSLVNSEAEWMYSWAPIGTPVVVHK